MSSWAERGAATLAILLCLTGTKVEAGNPFAGKHSELGRPATANEVAAWDIDVRPDFTGLPPGSGTALEGEVIWLEQCASCHGDFGDANNFFSPLVLGNVTDEDIARGHVAALQDPTRVRTTMMKVSTVSTLWDYIHRAMPWNNPKSLEDNEVYAVLAYLLNLAYIIDEDFVLDQDSITQVQARMPNRNGMTTEHGMWKVNGTPDTDNIRCMSDCADSPVISSFIPDFAANAHGNLALQSRAFGPFPGIHTAGDEVPAGDAPVESGPGESLAADRGCMACHRLEQKLVGPGFVEVATRYQARDDAATYVAGKIQQGGSGVWGGAMPPQAQVSQSEAEAIATWLLSLPQSKKTE
jgi:S-disulfanyl-L-cysteine oxidoreductase SoxD